VFSQALADCASEPDGTTRNQRKAVGGHSDSLGDRRGVPALSHALFLGYEPCNWHILAADAARSVFDAMPVGAAAFDQTQVIGDGLQSRAILGTKAGMQYFQSVEAVVREPR
jgi:hypothetical protein